MGANTLVLVANRLPWQREPGGSWAPAPGGLIAALHPIAHARQSLWVGADTWQIPGVSATEGSSPQSAGPSSEIASWPCNCSGAEVSLSPTLANSHYNGLCNSALWPTYHDAIVPSDYSAENWESHRLVTESFAKTIASRAPVGASVWIHDYQLQLLPRLVRQMRPDITIGFFLHIPFPAPEIFMRLPWRDELIRGLRGAHVIGFQTPQSLANFRRVLAMTASPSQPWSAESQPQLVVDPVSIDVAQAAGAAKSPQTTLTAARIRADLGNPHTLLLGVDRLDYTKGLPAKVRAIQSLFHDRSLNPSNSVFLQIASPTRTGNSAYAREVKAVTQAFGDAIGATSTSERMPIRLMTAAVAPEDLVPYFAAADIAVVTPLRDGMNLVAKEYVTVNAHADRGPGGSPGALVLSEFAGAAYELGDSYLVNPYSDESLRSGILQAVNDPRGERARRMQRLAHAVKSHTTFDWAEQFLAAMDKAAARQVIVLRPRTQRAA